MTRTVHVVPHTHWDREWYRPFQTFRMQLVDLLDELLPAMAADPAYAHFMLDGQMAVVDDYLAVRPEAEPLLRRLAAAGRVSMGPWYILMDEFLVSGETMVRDLAMGFDRAASFGGAMQVGYLPDMFGHVAQMPQILRQFGLDQAVVWRGVPAEIDRHAFVWEAPDGSRVRAAYLPTGYSNGAVLPGDAKEFLGLVDAWCAEQGARAGDPVLWMNGTDHLLPQAHLGRVIAEVNAVQDDYRLQVTSLAEHLAAAAAADAAPGAEPLPVWTGELRSGARANLLMGVASNRVDVHQAEIRTTQALERLAEPLAALYLPADRWPGALLHTAWLEVVRNCAHDSICACSVDEVGRAVIHRFDEAFDIADGVLTRALAAVAVAAGGTDPVLVNPVARSRAGVVELTVRGEEPLAGTQVVSIRPGRRTIAVTTLEEIETMAMAAVSAVEELVAASLHHEPDGTVVATLYVEGAAVPPEAFTDPVEALGALRTAVGSSGATDRARLDVVGRPSQRVLTRAASVPGFGWARWTPADLDVTPVTGGDAWLDNGALRVQVDPDDGTWSVNGTPGFGRLVDDGDAGDTYNYCPPALGDVVVDRPTAVTVEVAEAGPVRGRLHVTSAYRWPDRIEDGARVGGRDVVVRTTLELHAGDDLVRVTHELDNPCDDHRLRAWFPLPEPAATSLAETAFDVVERGLTAEGGPTEHGLPTFPSRRFVCAGGLTVAHEGLLEYELVGVTGEGDAARASHLALTLLRCTGLISQGPMSYRAVPAGPKIGTRAAQVRGEHVLRYAVHVGGRDPFAVADDAFLPLLVAKHRKGAAGAAGLGIVAPPVAPGTVDATAAGGTPLALSGAEVSAVVRTDGRLTVRVFNPTDRAAEVRVEGRRGWLVDLRGRPLEQFETTFALRAHGIATAVLDD